MEDMQDSDGLTIDLVNGDVAMAAALGSHQKIPKVVLGLDPRTSIEVSYKGANHLPQKSDVMIGMVSPALVVVPRPNRL